MTMVIDRRSFLFSGFALSGGLFLPKRLYGGAGECACRLDVELTQGPYYLNRGLLRKNITENRPGLPFGVQLTVLDANTCKPFENAGVEIWHCDASGIYSGYVRSSMNGSGGPGGPGGFGGPPPPRFDRNMGPPPGEFGPGGFGGPPQMRATDESTFFRGLQFTNAQGIVEFATIYPGWYVGRDTHFHVKVHTGGSLQNRLYKGGHVVHTGQLFFPDELSDEVARVKPYSARERVVRTRLDEDMVFADAHGAGLILKPEQAKSGSLEAGFTASAILHVDPSAVHDREQRPGWGGTPPR